MIPNIYTICGAPLSLLGDRIYPFGSAPQNGPKPYAVWQVIGGTPENCLAGGSVGEQWTIQIDIYGGNDVLLAASELRDALEQNCYISAYHGASRDPGTGLRRVTFDVSVWRVL